MGWGDCGLDSNGRHIGYVFEAVCDHPGCNKKIDRGLSYACGGMHGVNEHDCEKYFCEKHRGNYVQDFDGEIINICDSCAKQHIEDLGYIENDDGVLVESDD